MKKILYLIGFSVLLSFISYSYQIHAEIIFKDQSTQIFCDVSCYQQFLNQMNKEYPELLGKYDLEEDSLMRKIEAEPIGAQAYDYHYYFEFFLFSRKLLMRE